MPTNHFFRVLNHSNPQYKDPSLNLKDIDDPLEIMGENIKDIPVFQNFYNSKLRINFFQNHFKQR